jgi:SAM-dependent methyltransferase
MMSVADRRPALVRQLRRMLSPIPWRLVRRERLYHPRHDRYLLEQVIFPALRSRRDIRTILFVGTDCYTASYPALFADREFVTLDIDPVNARYGAGRHVVDTFANVGAHFAPGSLDAVICNGVVGWGLNRPDEIDAAMRQSFECLRPEGILILGWNDIEPWRPVPLEQIEGFQSFVPWTLPPFPSPTYPTLGEMRHVFSFYMRPDRDNQ